MRVCLVVYARLPGAGDHPKVLVLEDHLVDVRVGLIARWRALGRRGRGPRTQKHRRAQRQWRDLVHDVLPFQMTDTLPCDAEHEPSKRVRPLVETSSLIVTNMMRVGVRGPQ